MLRSKNHWSSEYTVVTLTWTDASVLCILWDKIPRAVDVLIKFSEGPPPILHMMTCMHVCGQPHAGEHWHGYVTAETEGGTGGRDRTELCHVGRKGHVTDLVPELDSAF